MNTFRNTSRRDFVRTLGVIAAAPALVGLTGKSRVIGGGFVPDGSEAGHRLRDGSARARLREGNARRSARRVKVAIVGGGMGGLSAAWRLDALGMHDWVLLELDARTGGNARSADYRGQRAPWGAHYVPVPSHDAVHVRELFRDLGVLGADGVWDERVLCHTPQERIWQHGRWHDGLEPTDAMSRAHREQFRRFEERIGEWRATGMFGVPTAEGHTRRLTAMRAGGTAAKQAAAVEALDTHTALEWMTREGFNAPALRWWVEYGTRDDYGASLSQASAWAAVHYFAGRDNEEQGPLTWPEGNDWIAQQLTRRLSARRHTDGRARILTGAPAWQIAREGNRWIVDTPSERVTADAVIWGAPLFVLPRVCEGVTLPVTHEYAPWVVANIVVDRPPASVGAELAWDNVIFGSRSLGYVNAAHQGLGTPPDRTVWTWYHAMVEGSAKDARGQLQQRSWSSWRNEILADLSRAHQDIGDCVARIDIMRWGHAMARPTPGVLRRVAALKAWQPAPRMFVAHADLSGLSLFEESQWHGVHAAGSAFGVVAG
ncbi:NAD(P)-binding protein [Gemmatimonas sp.]|uniref:NAD(P)-binding protein n=1 Tax=Gemmatimonas sp. TaxID=1962908 RepID=UPI0039836917